MPKELIEFKRHGLPVGLTVDDEIIAQEIREYMDFSEHWMLDFIEKYIKRGGTWIDCGANFGNHSIFFAMFCPCDTVLAVEPAECNYKLIADNIAYNEPYFRGCDICIEPCAVGAKYGLGTLKTGGAGRNSQFIVDTEGDDIDIFTIDSIVEPTEEVGLLKIDVEGMEVDVINGALKTIEKWKPEIFVEIWEEEKVQEIIALLTPFGYHKKGCYNPAPTYHFSTQRYPTMY